MKLVLAVVQDKDVNRLQEALSEKEFKLSLIHI